VFVKLDWREECAVFGIWGPDSAAHLTYLGLHALQHRGQEATGIVSLDGGSFHLEKGLGLVADFFTPERITRLPGHAAIGHNRYSTTGSVTRENTQPLTGVFQGGPLAVAHNGNLVNTRELRRELEGAGAVFQTTLDTELFLHLIALSQETRFEERVRAAMQRVRGAYSLVLANDHAVIGVRDPSGFRPLVLGRHESGAYCLASETCAFDLIGAHALREVKPGEIVTLDHRGMTSIQGLAPAEPQHCIFEHIYFSRPDSVVFGTTVDGVRRRLGRRLAEEQPADADVVISVPDSSNAIALSFAEAAGLPFEFGLIRNHYVGRTFIHPSQALRDTTVRLKYNAVRAILSGKRVAVVDDSIVRGTTSQQLVRLIRRTGAKEVHFRIGSPPITHPCFYGIDTPKRGDLIAATHQVEDIRRFLGVDTLGYLSLEGLRACEEEADHFCTSCFTGRYAVALGEAREKLALEGRRRWMRSAVESRA
jgi:amidophosphoribosyltransferase